MPSTMSCVGTAIGRPCAGERMLLDDSMRMRASACASADNGKCTAIWSPSKSALDAVPMQGRRTVQKHGVLADRFFEHVPHHGARALNHPLRALDVLGVTEVDESLHDERLEQLERHLLR